MKINTNDELSFTNGHAGLYLNKNEGAIAVEFKSSEIVLYLNTSLYQAMAWLLQNTADKKEIMDYVTWAVDPSQAPKNALMELHGPEHSVCLVCSPKHERVQLNFEIGISIDLRLVDFRGLIELVQEAQNDLEWRRYLLQWGINKEIIDRHKKENKDKKSL